jgi:hypothetical protein
MPERLGLLDVIDPESANLLAHPDCHMFTAAPVAVYICQFQRMALKGFRVEAIHAGARIMNVLESLMERRYDLGSQIGRPEGAVRRGPEDGFSLERLRRDPKPLKDIVLGANHPWQSLSFGECYERFVPIRVPDGQPDGVKSTHLPEAIHEMADQGPARNLAERLGRQPRATEPALDDGHRPHPPHPWIRRACTIRTPSITARSSIATAKTSRTAYSRGSHF